MIVYKTTNLVNGKFYVGQDSHDNPEYLGSGTILRHAIKKYGRASFRKETLQVCQTKAELNSAEMYWIALLDATNVGYNIALGGSGGKTTPQPWNTGLTKHTDERVARMAVLNVESHRGLRPTEATRLKMGKAHKGRLRTPEHAANISTALMGKTIPAHVRAKIAQTVHEYHPAEIVDLQCTSCGEAFKRAASRERLRVKDGRAGPFCSRSCSTATTHRIKPDLELGRVYSKAELMMIFSDQTLRNLHREGVLVRVETGMYQVMLDRA